MTEGVLGLDAHKCDSFTVLSLCAHVCPEGLSSPYQYLLTSALFLFSCYHFGNGRLFPAIALLDPPYHAAKHLFV